MAAEPWELHPYEGAGPLRFGMSRREVIDLLGMPQVVIHREPFLVEAVGDVHPEYSRGDCLVGVVTAGSSPLAWRGIMLTGRPVREVERDLQAAGVEIDDGEDGPVVPSLGIEIYAPEDDHYPNRGVQGVLVKSREYDTLDA